MSTDILFAFCVFVEEMMMTKLESQFQTGLKKELEEVLLPGCVVLVKPGFTVQGFPDLLILYKNRWAALECKRSINEVYQPNQKWWIAELDGMSFAAMICPENSRGILDEVLRSLTDGR